MTRRLLAAALLLATLTACGDRGEDASTPEAGDVPTTPRALAWVAAQTLPAPDRASATDDFDELGRDAVGIEMRYGSDGEYDGDLLALGVSDRLPRDLVDCEANDYLSGCVTTDDGVVLQWEEQVPEEDPGTVIVIVPRAEGAAVLFQSGEPVTGDPRELDLRVSVDEMIALGQDPRVAPTTTQEAVDGGEDLAFWVDS
ncbi:hypothetical protein G7072_13375 [Nocardioides sp. HDW12B]|uniref:hypothetical protein n=1 Tax=Nocardioides sp. HDW12B TaxID=2714939 RepID=UPI00140B04E0|nr:hypothetical protein [Nocardioides sp. HDW12B]QIK67203.1 hypothetical protein G7072_13375 [Nocardioides sp. HDW12B]